MNLQLALDVLDSKKAMELAEVTREHVDIIEIGTPLMKHEGIHILKLLREAFPEKIIFVDLKTMDVGEYEADFCFNCGADIVSVLGVADLDTIKGSAKAARKHNAKVLVDMINHPDKTKRAIEVKKVGADFIGVHSGIDQQLRGISPLNDLKVICRVTDMPVFVAGGINLSNIGDIKKENPDTVIVGGAITSSENPALAAKQIKESLL
ncbi:MAG: 3-hexulose-6-phosphate synthase [Deltaproteobacteria bacterium]|nr:3-hexulose-6-phosphate synthase [Deltaproteobacteria bacterium]